MRLIITVLLASYAVPASAQVAVSTHPATVEQAYRPVNARDPLIPSTFFGDQKGTAAPSKGTAAADKGIFSIYTLTLNGIMDDSNGRQALLRDPSGASYTLKSGRLMDSKKKTVPGVTGVVKGKQVILTTRDKKVYQLNLREKESLPEK